MVAANDEEEMNEWLNLIHKCMEEDSSAPKYVFHTMRLVSIICLHFRASLF